MTTLSIETLLQDGLSHLSLAGDLDTTTAGELETVVKGLLAQPSPAIIMDLSRLSYISSYGLRVLIFTAKAMKNHENKFVMHSLQPDVSSLIEMGGFSKFLRVKETKEEALDMIEGSAVPDTKVCPSDVTGLGSMLEWVVQWCKAKDVPSEKAFKLRLVLEEIGSNAVYYGFPGDTSGSVFCSIEEGAEVGHYIMIIADDGVPFNPLTEAAEPNIEENLEDRGLGGLGVFFVKNVSDEVSYDRIDGTNRMTVRL